MDGRGGWLGEESVREGDWGEREFIEYIVLCNCFWICVKCKCKEMNCRCCIVFIVKKKFDGWGILVLEDICIFKFLYVFVDLMWRG